MQRIFLKILAVALLLNVAAYGQSLADIARQYKEKEKQDAQQSSGVRPKVITNQDLGEGPEGRPDLRVERTVTASASGSRSFDHGFGEHGFGETGQRPENPFGQRQGQRQGPRQEQTQGSRQPWSGQLSESQHPEAQGGGEQWRQRVLEQESRVASMQARIDQMNAAARSGGTSSQGPYNRYQARQMERSAQMQQQLDEAKRKLESMQDSARRQGMHTQVYDP